MNGFVIFLCIVAAIILLIVLVLSIPVYVSFSYDEKLFLSVRYLFFEYRILPQGEKKEKKPKKEKKKKEKPKEEKPPEEEAKPKEKKPNPLLEMVKANGYDGMMEVLGQLRSVMSQYLFSKLLKTAVIDEFEIYVVVGKGDAAETAIAYGRACQNIYPLAAFLCNNHVVHTYDVSVECDFLANQSQGSFFFDFHVTVRKILNATTAMVVRMFFRVILKFLKNAKTLKEEVQNAEQAAQTVETSVK